MKTFILLALFAYAYAAELQHVPKIKVTKVVKHVPQAVGDQVPQVGGGDTVVPVKKVEIPVAGYQIPKHVQTILHNVHQHIPQVINHHIDKQKKSQGAAGQHGGVQVPHGVDGKVSQVVGQVAHGVGNKVQVPQQVQNVVDNVHHHIPQVINQHIASQKAPQVKPVANKV